MTLAEMRSEVAREHGWHLDDDGDRIDAELNELFGQAALELYSALERASEELRLIYAKDTLAIYDITLRVDIAKALNEARGRS